MPTTTVEQGWKLLQVVDDDLEGQGVGVGGDAADLARRGKTRTVPGASPRSAQSTMTRWEAAKRRIWPVKFSGAVAPSMARTRVGIRGRPRPRSRATRMPGDVVGAELGADAQDDEPGSPVEQGSPGCASLPGLAGPRHGLPRPRRARDRVLVAAFRLDARLRPCPVPIFTVMPALVAHGELVVRRHLEGVLVAGLDALAAEEAAPEVDDGLVLLLARAC